MHDIKWIRDEPEGLINALARRGNGSQEARRHAEALVAKLRGLDEEHRATLTQLETLLARRNAASKEIGQAKARKDETAASALMAEVTKIKTEIFSLEDRVRQIVEELHRQLSSIPNAPLAEVQQGADEHDNEVRWVHEPEKGRDYSWGAKQHFEIGEALGQMDFETAAKLSGARFVVNKGPLARLERALGQFFLDTHTAPEQDGIGGYMEVNPPLLVRDDAMFGTAQLPKFREDQFLARAPIGPGLLFDNWSEEVKTNPEGIARLALAELAGLGIEEQSVLGGDRHAFAMTDFVKFREAISKPLWLIPTAEVPLTNLVRESILSEEELPLRLTACTPCFRAEAGAAGRDTRGMIRQHQFTKVELVSITTPEKSGEEHERMLACAEAVLKKLDLHYRVVTLCTGDMGFASQKTYDIEVWLPGQGAFREISSCSVCGDFQARRMNARYRPAEGKGPRFVHTLNGSGVAVGRALVAVLETYQQVNGAVEVPNALLPYMGGLKTIEKLK
ncbi:serine--tRNA ligase [Xanthobacter autotrophicus]|uniref:serine--tRNA ligase n=1 Tax=Xanthobacter autotrophicus TaxID=280 RepID=UPI00372AC6C3